MRGFRGLWLMVWMLAGGALVGTGLPVLMESVYRALSRLQGKGIEDMPQFRQPVTASASFLAGSIVFGLLGAVIIRKIEDAIYRWETLSNADKITLFAGVFIGVLVSIPFHVLAFAFGPLAVAGSFVLMIILIWLSIAILRGMQDSMPWSSASGKRGNIKIFDTNVIIDGRVYEVCKAGFIEGKIYIPKFVLNELQVIADSHDPNRRQRGRRGLDMLRNLQGTFEIEVGVHDRLAGESSEPVDTRLVHLAQALGAQLVTNDFNLNKVAQVQGIPVLNINDLAMAMRPVFLPGDTLTVEIERNGSQPGQGVAYLEDGTMVVVEHGEHHIGERAEVQVTQVHQSAAGRMIFATIEGEENRGRRRAR